MCSISIRLSNVVAQLPDGWPAGVHPPGSEGFERTATAWLLDVVPPDYRLHGVLVRHPVALATLARHHANACVQGARQAYRSARADLGGDLPPAAMAAVLDAYRAEGARLVATAQAVELIERAVRASAHQAQAADDGSLWSGVRLTQGGWDEARGTGQPQPGTRRSVGRQDRPSDRPDQQRGPPAPDRSGRQQGPPAPDRPGSDRPGRRQSDRRSA